MYVHLCINEFLNEANFDKTRKFPGKMPFSCRKFPGTYIPVSCFPAVKCATLVCTSCTPSISANVKYYDFCYSMMRQFINFTKYFWQPSFSTLCKVLEICQIAFNVNWNNNASSHFKRGRDLTRPSSRPRPLFKSHHDLIHTSDNHSSHMVWQKLGHKNFNPLGQPTGF